MSATSYHSIKTATTTEYVVSRSRFLGYAAPASTQADVQEYIREVSARHPGATHCCWAYKVGFPDNFSEHFSDAGEPSGTAGRPILGVISQFKLQNVIIIVVRYFGGTKLGVRGLIDAYSTTARQTIERAEIIEKHQMMILKVQMPYSIFDTVKHQITTFGGRIISPKFETEIFCEISIPVENHQILLDELQSKGAKIHN